MTIMAMKSVSFLCHDTMKAMVLLCIITCVQRVQDGVTVDALFIAMEIFGCTKAFGHISVQLLSYNVLHLFLITL